MKTSKFLSVILIIAILSTSFLSINSSGLGSTPVDSGFEKHRKLSKAEIAYLVADENVTDYMNFYTTQPSVISPYSMGNVRSDIQQAALNRMNSYRRLAGLDPVSLNSEYTKLAQAAAVVNAANNLMTHYPSKPADMPDDLYNDGAYGARQSNIACYMGYRPKTGPLSYSVDMWMEDSDASNIDRLGHRRWILNPTMKSTGFGCATATNEWVYTAMYAFDTSAYCYDYNYISWPPSGYMANDTDFFTPIHAWNVSLSPDVYNTNNLSQLEVKLEDSRGNKWEFDGNEDDDGFFNVDLGGYGCNRNAIIFRPDGIEKYEGKYTVTIEGLRTKSNAPTTLTFEVDFFNSKKTETTEPSTQPTTYPTTQPTTHPITTDPTTATTNDSSSETQSSESTTLTPPTTSITESLIGDVNDDGKVSAADARTALRISAQLDIPTQEQLIAADVNGDGRITAADARLILRVSAKLESFTDKTNPQTTESEKTEPAKTEPTADDSSESEKNSDIVYITPTGKKYHRTTCRTLHDSVVQISRSSAEEQGYDACKVCKP